MCPVIMCTDQDYKAKELAEWTRHVYERAQEDAFHGDTVAYEVAAIVWSANILLLGFILEVPLTPSRQELVLVAALVSIIFTGYVPFVMHLTKIGQGIAQNLCRQIEQKQELPDWLRLHCLIDAVYPKKRGRIAVWFVSGVFLILWIFVVLRAFSIICRG